jgi:hypothetical protein
VVFESVHLLYRLFWVCLVCFVSAFHESISFETAESLGKVELCRINVFAEITECGKYNSRGGVPFWLSN